MNRSSLLIIACTWACCALTPSLDARPTTAPTDGIVEEAMLDETSPESSDEVGDLDPRLDPSYWPAATDRPTKAIGIDTVPQLHRVYEFGISRLRNDDNGVKTTVDTAFDALVRTGL
ncbi:MAG: hypothetical protein AAF517_26365, partial [Planctomycetota bacterium]